METVYDIIVGFLAGYGAGTITGQLWDWVESRRAPNSSPCDACKVRPAIICSCKDGIRHE